MTSAALFLPTVAIAAPTTTVADLDDFADNPAYAQFYGQKLDFAAATCRSEAAVTGSALECARVAVPLDWSEPGKQTIHVTIARRIGATPDGKRLLLSNPGGPGNPGLYSGAITIEQDLQSASTHYAIGMDPRGMGTSTPLWVDTPAVNPVDFRADGDSSTYTRQGVQAAIDHTKAVTAAVSAHPMARYINTVQTARDLNLVRAVLGFKQADYVGTSYGTLLGTVAAKMFPMKFDRVILEGNMEWDQPNYDVAWRRQVSSTQMAVDRLVIPFWSRHHDLFGLGSSVGEVNATLERLRHQLTDPKSGRSQADKFDMLLALAASFVDGPHQLGTIVGYLATGMRKGAKPAELMALLEQVLPMTSEEFATHSIRGRLAVLCGDMGGTPEPWQYFRDGENNVATRPVVAGMTALPFCTGWQGPTGALTSDILNRPLKQALMVQQEADPATGYSFAVDTRRRAGNVRLLAIDDMGGHGRTSKFSRCARARVSEYLQGGIFPAADVNCQADPLVMGVNKLTPVFEDTIYEVMNPGSDANIPKPYLYVMRDLRTPNVDEAATAAWRATNKPSTPSVALVSAASEQEWSTVRDAARSWLDENRGFHPGLLAMRPSGRGLRVL